ncbi:UDP-glucuronate 4-epimerase 4 [Fusarium oxysporum f. sp. cubense]|uniref:UDP-glucuronate 4-epimerase 4 n=1 Tax=Fusarium oxysporum f. sp. cubense TaxID=61366 RepID=A0A559LRW6_FUSOC|nr:UDP-glucuronate 4-epimerase 4 [Fusarium oxysporum f. sp. cubense]
MAATSIPPPPSPKTIKGSIFPFRLHMLFPATNPSRRPSPFSQTLFSYYLSPLASMTIITRIRISKPRRAILVTGGAGFISSHLVEALLAEGGWRVVVDNFDEFYDPEIKRANLAPHLLNPNLKLYEADIEDLEALQTIFTDNGLSAIVHLAARAGCAREFDVKQFLFGSPSSVYGLGAKAPFSENYKSTQPISPYATSKSAGELLCHTCSHLYDIRCICLRFFPVYGPRQHPDLAIHKFTSLIHQGKPIPLFGDGSSLFNLGKSQTIQLRDLIGAPEDTLGRKTRIDRKGEQAGDMPITYADISKAGAMLGYKPKTQVQQGIVKLVAWYLSQCGT